TADIVQHERNENQKERIAPYRPTIDKKLASLFEKSIPEKQKAPVSTIVDWSFLDNDDGQPGELPDWTKRFIKRLERLRDKDETTNEMIDDMINTHKWTRNIPPPST